MQGDVLIGLKTFHHSSMKQKSISLTWGKKKKKLLYSVGIKHHMTTKQEFFNTLNCARAKSVSLRGTECNCQ